MDGGAACWSVKKVSVASYGWDRGFQLSLSFPYSKFLNSLLQKC